MVIIEGVYTLKIPALICGIEKYSYDTNEIYDINNERLAEISHIPSVSLSEIIKSIRSNYIDLPINKLLNIITKAGKILVSDSIPQEQLKEYYKNVTLSTGLPLTVSKAGLNNLSKKMCSIDKIIKNELPYNKSCLDSRYVKNGSVNLAISPLSLIHI